MKLKAFSRVSTFSRNVLQQGSSTKSCINTPEISSKQSSLRAEPEDSTSHAHIFRYTHYLEFPSQKVKVVYFFSPDNSSKMGKSQTNKKNAETATSAAVRRSVCSLTEKIRELNSLEDLLELERIKKIVSALELRSGSEIMTCENDGIASYNSDTEPTAVNRLTSQTESETDHLARDRDNCEEILANDAHPATSSLAPCIVSSIFTKVNSCYQTITKKYFYMLKLSKSNFFGVFFSILAFIFYFELHTTPGFTRMWLKWENVELRSVECTIESPNFAMELFRPPVSCDICRDVRSVDRVHGISPSEFETLYAYSGRPVIVTDAMKNWSAVDSFSFNFFKSIYEEGSRSLEHLGEDCLFFPYSTEFRSLAEVFNMSQERHQRSWYIGWSNCDAETSHILRLHYERPYFLPETAESTHADWIFMGTPGYGAHMHIDHVINPSWQAQINGRKRWFLQPPPECFYECQSIEADVHSGDIIVLDTNKFYHQTEILPGEMSITIGSEYD